MKRLRYAYVLHETKEEHGQGAQVRRELQATTAHVATTELLLVSLQKLDDLGLDRIFGSVQTRAQCALYSLVREVVSDSLLVGARVHLGQVLSGRNAERQNANSALAIASSVQHTDLQTCESLSDSLVNSDLNNVSLIARHGRECTEVA